MFNTIIEFLNTTLSDFSHFGYVLSFLLALSETILGVGMITPGSTLLIFLGGYSAITGDLNFIYLVLFAVTGAVFGDNINFTLGKFFGKKWTKNGFWIVTPAHFQKGYVFFKKHGGKSVLFARFIPMIKEIVPFIAGTMQMNVYKFFIFNLIGNIGWALEFLGAGFIFSGSIALAKAWLGRASILFFIALILLIVLISFYENKKLKYGVRNCKR